MRGIVFRGEREIEVRELRDPDPGPGEVVIAMKASGLCGSDLKSYRATRDSRGEPMGLTAGGHEPCGVRARGGPGVAGRRPSASDGAEIPDEAWRGKYPRPRPRAWSRARKKWLTPTSQRVAAEA